MRAQPADHAAGEVGARARNSRTDDDRRVTVQCPRCGYLKMRFRQVRVVACSVRDWSTLSFTCPTCATDVVRPVVERVVELARALGWAVEPWHVPQEVLDPRRDTGPDLDEDAVIAFGLALGDVDDLAAVAGDRSA